MQHLLHICIICHAECNHLLACNILDICSRAISIQIMTSWEVGNGALIIIKSLLYNKREITRTNHKKLPLTRNLLKQEVIVVEVHGITDSHHYLVNGYSISVSQMSMDIFRLSYSQSSPCLIYDDFPLGL